MNKHEHPIISVRIPEIANAEARRVFNNLKHSGNSQRLGQSIAHCLVEAYDLGLACIFLGGTPFHVTSSPAVICVASRTHGELKTPMDLTRSDFHNMLLEQFGPNLDTLPHIWRTNSSPVFGDEIFKQSLVLKLSSDLTLRLSAGPSFTGYIALSAKNIDQTHERMSQAFYEISRNISQLLIDALQNELTHGLWLSFLHDVKHFAHRADLITFRLESATPAETEKLLALASLGNVELMQRAEIMGLLSKHQARGLDLNLEKCNLWTFLTSAISAHKEGFNKKDVSLLLTPRTPPSENPQIEADSALFPMVLHNLIGNALRYAPKGSQVELKLEEKDNQYRISISNQGEQISKEEEIRIQTLLASPGYLPSTRMRGIGLVASKLITNLHRGSLALEKEAGYATCFAVYLPRSP